MKVVIINFENIGGGVGDYLYYYSKALVNEGVRVIWFQHKTPIIDIGYRDLFNSDKIEKVVIKKNCLFKWYDLNKHIEFNMNDEIEILSFSLIDRLGMESFANKYKNIKIKNLYLVPHFEGKTLYPEEYNHILNKKKIYNYSKSIYNKLYQNNELWFFSNKHIETVVSKYGLKIDDPKNHLLNAVSDLGEWDKKQVSKNAERNIFRIITVGRMSFPHKGYIIGLIKDFARLSNKYHQLRLAIVGDGPDKQQVLDLIRSLDKNVQRKIEFLGQLSPKDMLNEFRKSQLNVSLAGCATRGAGVGTITLPCRHNCYDCEVYGFLPESIEYFLSTDPGEKIDKYVEYLINCSNEDFVNLSKVNYDIITKLRNVNPLALLNIETCDKTKISKQEMRYFKIHKSKEYVWSKICNIIK